jgi:hypothetical protein
LAWDNGFSPAQFAEAGKKHCKVVHLLEKRVINMKLLLPVFDWPIIMIVQVVCYAISSSHLFAVPV